MAEAVCPSHVKLMEGLTFLLEGKEQYFNPKTEAFRKWQLFKKQLNIPLNEYDYARIDRDFVALIQLLFLSPLIGMGNINNEFFQDCQFNQNEILVDWKGKSAWHLKFGIWDKSMSAYIKGFMQMVFKEDMLDFKLNEAILKRLELCYQNLNSNLRETQSIVIKAKQIAQVPELEKRPAFPVVFSILSAFPMDELNAFYLKLSAKLDTDMVIEDAVKMPININKFYQTPSQDITFLLEKIRLHFNLLFYGKGLKAHQRKLLKEFWPYLARRLENYDVKEYVLEQLNEALTLQFQARSQYYELMLRLLKTSW